MDKDYFHVYIALRNYAKIKTSQIKCVLQHKICKLDFTLKQIQKSESEYGQICPKFVPFNLSFGLDSSFWILITFSNNPWPLFCCTSCGISALLRASFLARWFSPSFLSSTRFQLLWASARKISTCCRKLRSDSCSLLYTAVRGWNMSCWGNGSKSFIASNRPALFSTINIFSIPRALISK